MMADDPKKTGECWCGCGESTGSYFAPGHDLRVQGYLLEMVYGTNNVVNILHKLRLEPWRSEGIRGRINAIRGARH